MNVTRVRRRVTLEVKVGRWKDGHPSSALPTLRPNRGADHMNATPSVIPAKSGEFEIAPRHLTTRLADALEERARRAAWLKLYAESYHAAAAHLSSSSSIERISTLRVLIDLGIVVRDDRWTYVLADDTVTKAFECPHTWADYQLAMLAERLGTDARTLAVEWVEVSNCDGIAVTTTDGRFFLWDPTGERMIEYVALR
jgi:hypothetical protein